MATPTAFSLDTMNSEFLRHKNKFIRQCIRNNPKYIEDNGLRDREQRKDLNRDYKLNANRYGVGGGMCG